VDSIQFLDTILPSAGLRCVAIPHPSGKGMVQFFGHDNAWLAEAAAHLDARGRTVYFAVSSFKDKSSRKQPNVAAVRSFWVDVDCGPGKPYATAKEGAVAILGFASKLGLGRPFLVRSGRGLHVYWPMRADLDGRTWKATAEILKAALVAEGIGQDPSRTADSSSVLRPPGTHHRKGEPRLVKVALLGEVMDLEDFQRALAPYAPLVLREPEQEFSLDGGPAIGFDVAGNADLGAGIHTRTSDAHLIADQCGVMDLFRNQSGSLDQPTWYFGLGILAYTEQGDEIAHEWSAQDPRYSRQETSTKLAQARQVGKPTTCAKFGEQHPTICAACPHAGKIKSPIVLGMEAVEQTVDIEEQVHTPSGWITKKVSIKAPEGFKFIAEKGRMVMQHAVPDPEMEKDDKLRFIYVTFCESLLIPITRLWIDGVAYVECEMTVQGENRRFLLEGGLIGKGKDTLAAELARNEVVCLPNKGPAMDSYLKRWMTDLKESATQVIAYRHFGWESRAFIMGDVIFTPDGGETRAVLHGMAKSKVQALHPKGDLETWVRVIDTAYNAPGQEAFQFLVGCSFAAPLLSMLQQVNGVTVYAHTEGSGAGKTTAQKAGLSAWGDADDLMLADNKVTTNALWGLMGAYSTLPIVFDELTNQKNDVASDLVFSVSSGRAKQRMRSDGELSTNNSNWSTILMASGNNLLSEKLALHRGNAEAEISRLFEFTLTAGPHLTPNDANALFPLLKSNHGHAGRVFARYLVDHYDEVAEMLKATQVRLTTNLKLAQVERHWSALLASTLVAVSLCRKLGLLQFDVARLTTWLVARLNENRVQRNEASSDALELLGSMLADLWQGVLVTQGEGDLRRNTVASVIQAPRGQMVGRAIVPTLKTEVPVLMLNEQAVRDWANKKGVSAREIFKAAVTVGWADPLKHRYALGRGTVEYSSTSSYISAWRLYPDRIGAGAGHLVAQKMGLVHGGVAAAGAGSP